jgi:hypothetical protein
VLLLLLLMLSQLLLLLLLVLGFLFGFRMPPPRRPPSFTMAANWAESGSCYVGKTALSKLRLFGRFPPFRSLY